MVQVTGLLVEVEGDGVTDSVTVTDVVVFRAPMVAVVLVIVSLLTPVLSVVRSIPTVVVVVENSVVSNITPGFKVPSAET